MTIQQGDQERRPIPRWHVKRSDLDKGELGGNGTAHPVTSEKLVQLDSKLGAWSESKTLADAIDVVAAGILSNATDRIGAALEQVRNNAGKSEALLALVRAARNDGDSTNGMAASDLTLSDEPSDRRARIANIRRSLVIYPRNAFLWNALSRAYASLGHQEKATQSMDVAISLAPHSRFIVRSATRLFVHLGNHSKAHNLLLKQPGLVSDPWILAAELAVSSIRGRHSRFSRKAKELAEDTNFPLSHRSELNSSLATIELGDGAIRQSKKYFKESLRDPTENAAAQAVWATGREKTIAFDKRVLALPRSHEANTLQARSEGSWKQALESCRLWQDDEPFSTRPPIEGSYLSVVATGDLDAAEQFARCGLASNPSSSTLRNNLLVALVLKNELDSAADQLTALLKLSDDPLPRATGLATTGLLSFRLGEVAEGRKHYELAIQQLRASNDFRGAALAAIHLAIEEMIADGATVESDIKKARDLVVKAKAPEISAMFKRALEERRPFGTSIASGNSRNVRSSGAE